MPTHRRRARRCSRHLVAGTDRVDLPALRCGDEALVAHRARPARFEVEPVGEENPSLRSLSVEATKGSHVDARPAPTGYAGLIDQENLPVGTEVAKNLRRIRPVTRLSTLLAAGTAGTTVSPARWRTTATGWPCRCCW